MAWKINFRKDTLKFLLTQEMAIQERIRRSLNTFLDYLNKGVFPFNEMDIKKLKGKQKDFMRLRIGKIRVIFKLDTKLQVVKVYTIDYRGDVY